ncbi:MAG: hypothetical protein H6847_01475 [Hyphomonas sp.]|nr:hypothetical protein [Hyphomonas sp.]MCB9970148.1 hypothetical protein [Hyphomonas sp.]
MSTYAASQQTASRYQFEVVARYAVPRGCRFSSPAKGAISTGFDRISLDILCKSKTSGWGGDSQKVVLNSDDLSVVRYFEDVAGLVCKGPRLEHLPGDRFILACAEADKFGEGGSAAGGGRVELKIVDYSKPEISSVKSTILASDDLPGFHIHALNVDDDGNAFVGYSKTPAGLGHRVSEFGTAAINFSENGLRDLHWPLSVEARWCDGTRLCSCDDVLLTPQKDWLLLCSLRFTQSIQYVRVERSRDGDWQLNSVVPADQFFSSQSGEISGGKYFKYFDKMGRSAGKDRLVVRDVETMRLLASRFRIRMDDTDSNIAGIAPLENGRTLAILSDHTGSVRVALLGGDTLEDRAVFSWKQVLGKARLAKDQIPFALIPADRENSFFLVSRKEIYRVVLTKETE